MSRVVPENLCYMPWSSLTLLPDGRITTCCASLGKGDELGNSKKGDSLLDVWHGDKLKKVREQFLAGEWPKGCLACKKRHTSGLASQKDHYYSVLKGHNLIESIDLESNNLQPLYLDLAFSNVCNLSCRMCSSVFSSKWISVDRHLLEAGFQHLSEHALADSSTETDFRAIASLLPELPHLHIVVIKGGEPLLSKHFVQFLRVLTDKGYAQNIELKMTTNGTIPPSEEVIGLFKEFKKVGLSISVDGVGRLFNYIRSGRDYHLSAVEESIPLFQQLDNSNLTIYPTIHAYNVFDIENIYDWSQKFNVDVSFRHILTFPRYLQLGVLPRDLRTLAKKRLEKFLGKLGGSKQLYGEIEILLKALDSELDSECFAQFVHYTRIMDNYHQIHLEEIVPEFKGILDLNTV